MAKMEKAPAVAAAKFLAKAIKDQTITFTLENGLKVVAELSKIHADVITDLTLHGLSQKVGDSAAKFSKERDYHGAFSAMQSVVDNLEQGVWSTRGSGSADLAQALANLMGADIADIEANLRVASEEERDAFLDDASVKAEIAKIKAERAKAKAEQSEPADLKKLWKAFSSKGAAV